MSPELAKQLLLSARLIKFHDGTLEIDGVDGVTNITEISREASTHIEYSIAFVETDSEKFIYVIVPGSNDRDDWLANFQFRFQDMVYKAAQQMVAQAQEIVELPEALADIGLTVPHAHVEGSERWSEQRVHGGFMRSYYGIQDKALADLQQALADYPDAAIYGTAHSLGSAILRFLFLDSQFKGYFGDNRTPIIHTFGAPRMGNAAFTKSLIKRLPNITRVVHGHDLVTRLPLPLIGYRHEIIQSHIGRKSFMRWFYRDDIRDHYLDAYIERLKQSLS